MFKSTEISKYTDNNALYDNAMFTTNLILQLLVTMT